MPPLPCHFLLGSHSSRPVPQTTSSCHPYLATFSLGPTAHAQYHKPLPHATLTLPLSPWVPQLTPSTTNHFLMPPLPCHFLLGSHSSRPVPQTTSFNTYSCHPLRGYHRSCPTLNHFL